MSLCVAVGNENTLLTSTDPSKAWRISSGRYPELQSVVAISCPSDTLCVAIENGSVDTSTDPAGGASTWTQKTGVVTSGHFTGVSCPTTTLCVAVTSDGQVATSIDPADGSTAAWNAVSLGGQLAGVSCASSTACVLGAGQRESITVSLNAAGKKLLSERHTLKVRLAITESGNAVFRETITFSSRPKKKH